MAKQILDGMVISDDGTQLAYSKAGQGPGLMLLHGGGGNRQEWVDIGYAERLQDEFTVIMPDIRGQGESDLPTSPGDYTPEKYSQDIFAVADVCDVHDFTLWGFSYGGKVGRYAPINSDRVNRFIMLGTPLGPGVMGSRKEEALNFKDHWGPIYQSMLDGSLSVAELTEQDKHFLRQFDLASMLAWVTAMLEWPEVTPSSFLQPVLWLFGSEDGPALESYQAYQDQIPGSELQLEIIAGLTHEEIFEQVDKVFPMLHSFTIGNDHD
jgi:pimeloyl-ACP methyl ester carboxylesterase